MRLASWTVVFGAVAALVYSHFKPFFQNLEWPDVDPDQSRGALVAPASEPAPLREPKARCDGDEAAEVCSSPEN